MTLCLKKLFFVNISQDECISFSFGFGGGMWVLIAQIPDFTLLQKIKRCYYR